MKKFLLAATAAVLMPGVADATTFVFASGTYMPGTTSPSPLLAPDVLSIQTSSNKTFGAGAFVNQSGTVNWLDGTIFLSGGSASVSNAGTWNMLGDNVMTFSNGGGTFTNSGLLAKTGGSGVSSFSPNNFVNSGTINAQVGTIELNGSNNMINAGSVFSGAGTVLMDANGTFNGSFTSSNLDLAGGNFTGNGAILNGSADFLIGTMNGTWNVAAGSTLNLNSSSNKFIGNGTFDNDGTVMWNNGTLFLSGGSANFVNDGAFISTGDTTLTFANGGGTFTNNGTLQKNGGTGVTAIGVTSLVNNGTISAQTGTMTLSGGLTFNAGSAFTGAGTVSILSNATFNGAFSSANLDFNGGTYTGNNAVMSGAADFLFGGFAGTWNVASGATLNINTSSNKFFGTGTFDNDGTVVWNDATLFLSGGGANIRNDGLLLAAGDNVLTFSNGGGTLTNNGVIRKSGSTGVTTLGAPVVNNGMIDVQSGTIALTTNFVNPGTMAGTGTFNVPGTLTNNGTIAPGNAGTGIGTLSLTGNYVQGAAGLFSVGFGPGGTADLFNISGTAALNGTLGLNCLSCSFNAGDLFTILDSVGDLSGTFANVTTNGFNQGFAYSVIYDLQMDRVQLRIDNVGTPTTPPGGGAVPEPATWAMLLFGFGAMGSMLRRRRGPVVRVRYA